MVRGFQVTVLLLVVGGCVGDDAPLTSGRQAIVGGDAAEGDPSVALLTLGGQGLCTGTLITPKIVLTAAHCLLVPAEQMRARFVASANEPATVYWGAEAARAPDGDIALLLLEEEPPVPFVPHNRRPLEDAVGAEVRIVGFGTTGEEEMDAGVKREGVAAIDRVTPNPPEVLDGEMATTNNPQGTCYGDSGGPNFINLAGVEVVAGVTSRGTAACGAGLDIAARVDLEIGWMDAYIAVRDPADCGADGRCSKECEELDLDCCYADGVCTAECGDLDPECSGELAPISLIGEGGERSSAGDGGGCASAQGTGLLGFFLLLAAAWCVFGRVRARTPARLRCGPARKTRRCHPGGQRTIG